MYGSRRRGISSTFYIPGFPSGVKWLLIANTAVFIIGCFAYQASLSSIGALYAHMELQPRAVVETFAIWQLVTYMFLHGGFGHILWNMLALWMFGADLERDWGTRRFLNFYFFCGIGAGICVVLANYLIPRYGNPDSLTIGCSGAIFGLLLAYAMAYPDRTILFGFLIPIQVKWFVLIIGVISFMSAFAVNSGVSEFAHLGGLLFAYVWLKSPRGGLRVSVPVGAWYHEWRLRRAKRKFQVYLRKQGSDRDPWLQ